ncbi:hypothetical protein [Kordiimonas sp.]|uniref:hypothetical protein n=1 Tax=Kordiimonas sp. TaxID=1970157 RepID=UPI003A92B4D4
MAKLETYDTEAGAIGARDHYNHTLGKRATVFPLPTPADSLSDFGGGGADKLFKDPIDPGVWVLVVED